MNTSWAKAQNIVVLLLLIAVMLRLAMWMPNNPSNYGCLEKSELRLKLLVVSTTPSTDAENEPRPNPNAAEQIPARSNKALGINALGFEAQRFAAKVEQPVKGCPILTDALLRLSWYQPEFVLQKGMTIHSEVRLKRPWGTSNPGSFDYQIWLMGKGYTATGHIRHATLTQNTTSSFEPIVLIPHELPHRSLLAALLLGQRQWVSRTQWRLYRDTGTVHLLVISGMHVGIVVGFMFMGLFAGTRLLAVNSPCWQPRRIAWLLAALCLPGIMFFTGPQPPVIRACSMAVVVVLLALCLRQLSALRILALIACTAVLIQPQIIFQHGFWLSYLAVFNLLFYFLPRRPTKSWVQGLCHCQWVMTLALFPWLALTVNEVALISPVANIVVVPLITLFALPAGLLGIFILHSTPFETLGEGLLWVTDYCIYTTNTFLQLLSNRVPNVGYWGVTQIGLAVLSAWLVLLPIGWRKRSVALLGWLYLFNPQSSDIPAGHFRLQVLDVGQGSAAIIDTQHSRTVVDTGASYASGFSVSESVLVPALRSTGDNSVNRVLISHLDTDHAGGLTHLLKLYPTAQTWGATGECPRDLSWRQDDVHFRLISHVTGQSKNDRSCVLVVDNGSVTAVLSGDISRRSERRLLSFLPHNVDVLIAPHHGSKTSSSYAFVRQLNPRWVVFSAGRNNHYGHPAESVLAHYARVGAHPVTTWGSGMITWSSLWPKTIRQHRCEDLKQRLVGNCRPLQSSGAIGR